MAHTRTRRAGIGSLVRAGIRQHKASLVGVVVAVFAASTLVTALGVLIESGVHGGYAPQRYAAADVMVGGRQSVDVPEDAAIPLPERAPLPRGTLDAVTAVSGVATVVPDVTAELGWSGSVVEAHGWSSAAITPYALRAGRAPAAASEVVVDAATAPKTRIGDSITLEHGGTPARYSVVGIAAAKHLGTGSSHAAQSVFLSDAQADALSPHPGSPPILAVFARNGVSADALASDIRAHVPHIVAYTGQARGDAEFLDAAAARTTLVALGSSFAGTSILIALFIVAGTLSLSIQSRKRDFALLRAVGSTPGQIHRLVTGEVLIVATLAAVAGIAPGYLLSGVLQSAFGRAGVIPADFALTMGPLPAVSAVVLAVLAACGASAVAARRAARINPIEALREASITPSRLGRGRTIAGVILVAVGLAASAMPLFLHGSLGVAGAAGAAVLLIVAVALLGPRLAGVGVAIVGRALRRPKSPATFLAQANTRGNARRLAAAITPLALGITLGLVQLGTQSIVAAEAGTQSRAGVTAELMVSGHGSGLSPERVAAISHTTGVRAANPVAISQAVLSYREFGDPESDAFPLQGIDPRTTASTMDLGVVSGSLDALTGPTTVALSTDVAQTAGLRTGDTVRERLGDGTPVRATIVATYKRGLGFGDVTMTNDVVRSHTSSGFDDYVLVHTEPSARAQVQKSLEGAGLVVADRAQLHAAGEDTRDSNSIVNSVALIVILGYIAIAVVNTLVMATAERRREFALLRLIGSTRRQVRAMMRGESIVVTITAAVLGTLVAIPPLVGVSIGISGQPVPNLAPLAYVIVVGSLCLLGLGALAVSTRFAMRTRPIDEIGSRE